jgi:hypothetical protein
MAVFDAGKCVAAPHTKVIIISTDVGFVLAPNAGGFNGPEIGAAAHRLTGKVNSDIEDGLLRPDTEPPRLYELVADPGQTTNRYHKPRSLPGFPPFWPTPSSNLEAHRTRRPNRRNPTHCRTPFHVHPSFRTKTQFAILKQAKVKSKGINVDRECELAAVTSPRWRGGDDRETTQNQTFAQP